MTNAALNERVEWETDWEVRVAAEARGQAAECFQTARVPAPFQPALIGATEMRAGGGPVLGVLPDPRYESATIALAPGETVLLFTDGLTEARQGRGALFGPEGVLETVAKRDAARDTPNELGQAILDAAAHHAGNNLTDDVCLLVVKKRPEEA